MPEPYTYRIDISEYDGNWRTFTQAQTRSTLNARNPKNVARATLENYIVDYPEELGGGERVAIYGEDDTYPPDNHTHVRVFVFRGSLDEHEPEPCAAAYLVDLPQE